MLERKCEETWERKKKQNNDHAKKAMQIFFLRFNQNAIQNERANKCAWYYSEYRNWNKKCAEVLIIVILQSPQSINNHTLSLQWNSICTVVTFFCLSLSLVSILLLLLLLWLCLLFQHTHIFFGVIMASWNWYCCALHFRHNWPLVQVIIN